jgi:GT2 family glycosyltransferase
MMAGVLSSDDTRRGILVRELPEGSVTVVVIAYNDAVHVTEAVDSALAQGDAVGEVVVVDDASTDGTGGVADRLAEASPRVRVIHRATNSGGCGTPRNNGADAARGEWIVFLDSDDVLPPGAVDALRAAARRHGADVVAGLCVRKVLPEGREVPWQPDLFTAESVHDGIAGRARTLWDTLSVNKLYRRAFLTGKGIRFPDGAVHYEDFVFTGRLYAAAPRFAVIPDTVYVWHARPKAAQPSISLRQDRIGNWLDRLTAHRGAMDALSAAGEYGLVSAAQTKFLVYDIPMYLRELHRRTPEYQREWWRSVREHITAFTPRAVADAAPADRWRTAVLLGRETPADAGLRRLAELSAVPPRLAPPLARSGSAPVWDAGTPEVRLDGVTQAGLAELPLCVSADVRTGREITLRLSLSELYGRVAEGHPEQAEVILRNRVDHTVFRRRAVWREDAGGGWRAAVAFDTAPMRGPHGMTVWDAVATVVFRSGDRVETKIRAGGGLGRRMAAGRGAAVLLLSAYATVDRSLAVRVAGARVGVRQVLPMADRLLKKLR